MLPQLAEIGNIFPKTVSNKNAPCKEMIRRDNFNLTRSSHPQVLAAGRRPLHHAALRRYPRPAFRQAQHRNVPDAGLRRPDHRHALAAPEGRRRHLRERAPRRRSLDRGPPQAMVAFMAESAGGASPFPTAPSATSPHPDLANNPPLEVAVAIGTDPSPPSPPSYPRRPRSRSF